MRYAALGAFDGMHLGHMSVLQEAGKDPGIVFFEPVPRQVTGRGTWRGRLTTAGERYEMLRCNGISSIITLPFDKVTAGMPHGEFPGFLAEIGPFDGFVVGYDFRYGHRALGTTETLKEGLGRLGLGLRVVEPFTVGSIPVKSGRIRELLEQGDLQGSSELLGRLYGATGVVSRGRGLGRKLGFPTLNLRVPGTKLLPPAGSYAVFADMGTGPLRAVAFVVPPRNLVEVHVPGFSGDIYGADAKVEFVSFLRKPQTFGTVEGLAKQIKNDMEISMEVLKEWH
jgi:riboflavin kinase/FMN adenylyltransferase